MAGLKDLSQVWDNIQEFDLRPIRESALLPVRIVIVGDPGSGRHHLADTLRRDLDLRGEISQTPLTILDLESLSGLPAGTPVPDTDLLLLTISLSAESVAPVHALLKRASDAGLTALLICDLPNDTAHQKVLFAPESAFYGSLLAGSLTDPQFLRTQLIPKVLAALPEERHLALGRQFPLFRIAIARDLIDDTCLANATYSFSTGLAEAIPVFTLPLSVTDMIILTKAQAFLTYKLGLLLGFSTQWKDYLAEFGSVVGGGFVLRQIARSLIGLVPGWGIAPKVIIAYSGTYVVGQTILQWYLAGRQVDKAQLQGLYRQAALRGKTAAAQLLAKLPRPRRRTKPKRLPKDAAVRAALEGEIPLEERPNIEITDPPAPKKARRWGWPRRRKTCPACGQANPKKAAFCLSCGLTLT